MTVQSETRFPGPRGAPPDGVVRVQPTRGLVRFDLREFVHYRQLLVSMLWRDVKVRYKQTFLGAFWAIFRPLVSMVMFSIIFGNFVGIDPGSGLPYPLFVFAGLLPWLYFASAVSGGSASIVGNSNLIGKIYFPRIYVVLAAVATPLVDFVLSFVVMFGLFGWFGRFPSWQVVTLPLFLALALVVALGIGLWLGPVTARYRDVTFGLPFLTQLLMYTTPVIYPVSVVPERWRWAIDLNPMTGVVDGCRWALLGGDPPSAVRIAFSVGIAFALVVSGLVYFGKAERRLVDVL